MTKSYLRGRALPTILAVSVAIGVGVLTTRGIVGQSTPSPAPTPTTAAGPSSASAAVTSPAPAVANDDAVRMILPSGMQGSDRLPVQLWARADMPDAPGGYVIFISTIYASTGAAGSASEWLLTNYLQWDGAQWLIGLPDTPGRQLQGEQAWLAQNLTDVTAAPSPAGQAWRVFTVEYTGNGDVSPTLSRDETLVEIYDLGQQLRPVWSRIDSLTDIDTSNAGWVKTHSEEVDWTLKDIDGDGVAELIATVTDTDDIALTGAATSGAATPAPGTTQSTATEVYKWINGAYALQGGQPAQGAPSGATPTATPSSPVAPTATPVPTAPQPARTSVPQGRLAPPTRGPTVQPQRTPAG